MANAPELAAISVSAFNEAQWLRWVNKRLSAKIAMRLLSVSRGAIHGYRYNDHKSCNTVEQR